MKRDGFLPLLVALEPPRHKAGPEWVYGKKTCVGMGYQAQVRGRPLCLREKGVSRVGSGLFTELALMLWGGWS